MAKVVAVVGSTGLQGTGVVTELLKTGWKVRALTRKPTGEAAKSLKNLGAEIVEADIDKVEDLRRAFSGVDAVFAVTDFLAAGAEGEIRQGKLMIDVAKQQKVSFFLFSSLDHAEKSSGGKNKVPHFTSKGIVDDYLFASGVPGASVQVAGYYENWLGFFTPRKNADGVYEFTVALGGDKKWPLVSAAETGKVVAKILNNKEQFVGKKVAMAGDYLTPNEVAATISKVWGKPVRANVVPTKVFGSFPFPHAEEFADMYDFIENCGYYGEKVTDRDIWEAKKLCPDLLTLEQWLRATLPSPRQ